MQTNEQRVMDLARQVFQMRRELDNLHITRAHCVSIPGENPVAFKVTGHLINANGILYHVALALISHLEMTCDPLVVSDLKVALLSTRIVEKQTAAERLKFVG